MLWYQLEYTRPCALTLKKPAAFVPLSFKMLTWTFKSGTVFFYLLRKAFKREGELVHKHDKCQL